ncbi:helix-turn-helix domain-containing protein [Marinimicrobium sp. ABcell2]|uniref:helix-turn-helix domain-containing protein n=1 Tax=Marinimicrobium sp. ABcell2 TaxID=3069751 RepID=UPI0027B3AC37|nr:helix-turn-helix domain-containing protein [Marinimicrobium sp. ABcell2]MDQ2075769.1 helix-turn-helix domain-containing protein [Marinimicrobium sp. ABcell2]
MNKKTSRLQKKAASKSHLNNTSTRAQRKRLLDALIDLGAVNTLYARDRLNILMPAARIKELKNAGHDIFTDRITITDRDGRPHSRVARYVLIKLASNGGSA